MARRRPALGQCPADISCSDQCKSHAEDASSGGPGAVSGHGRIRGPARP
ncbi:hypothetical protein STRAU_2908 [Streptomyces aurantiacus JA 4570]|uniref:Uncharacterized protein n=1 Tax=Streptomyces aurantiacus JA 4570 TaxID=1286094 RepID=S4A036_9ACTN|nr:hypothetical protein STRAU_2908 [Streptomyces aurantiacus JA 4570]